MYKTGWDYLNEIDELAEEARKQWGWRRHFDVGQLEEIERARQIVAKQTDDAPELLVVIARLADLLDERYGWSTTD